MSDKTQGKTILRAVWMFLFLAVVMVQSGCEMNRNWRSERKDPPQTNDTSQAGEDSAVGDSRKFQSPREVAPEDIEAFQNAVEQVSRLEYGAAESELRQLLVRFESVDDPKYVSETLFWLGYCCEKEGVTEQARDYYQRVVEHYPQTRPGMRAQERMEHLPAE
ncbi:MAG: tetratricopeptide repeat protein [Phycisphaerae bacterium]|nr:tetratricopeptide repeat protein [Phycisphaerae bacterium]